MWKDKIYEGQIKNKFFLEHGYGAILPLEWHYSMLQKKWHLEHFMQHIVLVFGVLNAKNLAFSMLDASALSMKNLYNL